MEIRVNANRIIDTIISEIYDIKSFHDEVPKGAYVSGKRQMELYYQKERAQKAISLIEEVYSVPYNTFYKAAMIVERWYTKTEWQRNLSEETAEKLLACMIEQNTRDTYDREGGNDNLLYMNRVISDWAKRNKKESA